MAFSQNAFNTIRDRVGVALSEIVPAGIRRSLSKYAYIHQIHAQTTFYLADFAFFVLSVAWYFRIRSAMDIVNQVCEDKTP